MSETGAVKPTGETGARCPCCQEAVDTITRLNDGKREYHTAWRCRCFVGWHDSPESALSSLVAARPLPDFPAGAPDKSKVYEALERFQGLAIHGGNDLDRQAYGYLSLWAESVVNAAPARPAAAGLALNDAQVRECEQAALHATWSDYEDEDKRLIGIITQAARASAGHAESLLSSRATGAEVEIVIPEPSEEEMGGMMETAGMSDDTEKDIYRLAFATAVSYARRHATMRGGGE